MAKEHSDESTTTTDMTAATEVHERVFSSPVSQSTTAATQQQQQHRRTSDTPELDTTPHHRRAFSLDPFRVVSQSVVTNHYQQQQQQQQRSVSVSVTSPVSSNPTNRRNTLSSTSSFRITDISPFQDSWTNATVDSSSSDPMTSPVNNNHNTHWSSSRSLLTAESSSSSGHCAAGARIHNAARITDWDTVLQLCEEHPEQAAYRGPRDGWTALHHACNRRCPRPAVVRALIAACPAACAWPELEQGWLPLHYACRFKAPKAVVQLLLDTYPAAVSKRDRLDRTPLYYAVRYDAPPGVVSLLLQMDPSVVLDTATHPSATGDHSSPLALVWDLWAEKLEGKRLVNSFLPGGFEYEPADISVYERAQLLRARLKTEKKLEKRWNKANMLLKAAFGFPVEDEDEEEEEVEEDSTTTGSPCGNNNNDDDKAETTPDAPPPQQERKWRIVHATAAVKCHLSLFLLACALHPEQVAELDESDLRRPGDEPGSHQTALHLAASSNADGEAGKAVVLTLLSLYREAAQVQDGIDGSLPLHRMVENERKKDWPQHAAILYHFYPRAVQIPDRKGRLPLHRAAAAMTPQVVENNNNNTNAADNEDNNDNNNDNNSALRSVIIQLVRAFPQAASRPDMQGYFPLHLAAMNATVWDENLDAIFNSHRAAVHARAGPHSRLPVHMAAASFKRTADESILKRLLQFHPRAATLTDREGYLPLHLCCATGNDAGVLLLHEAYPAAVRQVVELPHRWLPLHMACASDCGHVVDHHNSNNEPPAAVAANDLISKLVHLYPAAASIPDRQGRYPLHLACASGKNWRDLEILFQTDAAVAATPNAAGEYPFLSAALRYCCPNNSPDNNNMLVPWQEKDQAKEKTNQAAELDILFQLLRCDPTILP